MSRPPAWLRGLILVTTLASVAIGGLNGSGRWGQPPAEFAADSDRLLRVAAYAFSIWGPIYLGLIAYAVRGVLVGTDSPLASRLAVPSLVAVAGIGLWIVAAAADAELWTIVLIVGSATALVWPLLAHADLVRAPPRWSWDRAFVLWPLAALAGWLTVASPVNLLTVAAGDAALPPGVPEGVWPFVAVVGAAAAALAVTAKLRTLAYPLPIAWGLGGVAVAEHLRGADVLALAAAAAASAAAIGGLTLSIVPARRRRWTPTLGRRQLGWPSVSATGSILPASGASVGRAQPERSSASTAWSAPSPSSPGASSPSTTASSGMPPPVSATVSFSGRLLDPAETPRSAAISASPGPTRRPGSSRGSP